MSNSYTYADEVTNLNTKGKPTWEIMKQATAHDHERIFGKMCRWANGLAPEWWRCRDSNPGPE